MATFTTLGSVDLAKNSPQSFPNGSKMVLVKITLIASYPTGGEAIAASDLGLDELLGLVCVAQASEEYWFSYDNVNKKVAAFDVDSEVAASTDLSAALPIFLAFGR